MNKKIFLFDTDYDAAVKLVAEVIKNCFQEVEFVNTYEDCDICIIGTFPKNFENINFEFLSNEKINFFVIGESSKWFEYFRNIDSYKNKNFLDKVYVVGMEKDFMVGKKFINLPFWKTEIDWFDNDSKLISLKEIKNNKWKMKQKESAATFVASYKYWELNEKLIVDQRYRYVEMLQNNFLSIKESFNKNIPKGSRNKLDFISNYLVHLPFENAIVPGYVTEKLFHGLVAGSINLYYGDISVENDFNKDAFFIFNNEESFFIQKEKIESLINSKKKINQFLKIDPFLNNINIDYFINEIYNIIGKKI